MSEVKSGRQDNASLQSRINVIEDNFAASSSAWTRERDLLQKQVAGLKQRDVQYQHDIRRLEREGEQLRTKLRQMLATKDKIARVALPVASSEETPGSSFGQIETYKSMISRYDDQQRSLLAENEQVRRKNLAAPDRVSILMCWD
jgi:predicted  nucleic acid-binding Zn-ribbon protein